MGKEKVENREKRGTIEPRSTIWRKDKAERGLGFSNIYLHLSGFRIGFFFALMFFFFFGGLGLRFFYFFIFNIVLRWKFVEASKVSVLYIYIYIYIYINKSHI